MARRRDSGRRQPMPDAKYGSTMLMKFINTVMKSGKKSVAESIVYGALDIVNSKIPNEDPMTIFNRAIDNAKPMVHVKARRVGGATYQVPVEIPADTRTSIAFRWVIEFSRKRGEKTMRERLAAELIDCLNNTGATVKRKEDTHRMAEANKAFAHFRY
ncbi:MAG: 30S ribosomal protein S7 [Candidatus Hydrogenedentota bacterium]